MNRAPSLVIVRAKTATWRTETKTCIVCAETFAPRPGMTRQAWDRQKCCDARCAHEAVGRKAQERARARLRASRGL